MGDTHAVIRVLTRVSSALSAPEEITVAVTVRDADGNEVARRKSGW